MSTTNKTIFALLTGALAGAAVAIYFASGKGDKLKGKLVDDAENLVERSQDAMAEFKEKLYKKANNSNHVGHDKAKKARQHS